MLGTLAAAFGGSYLANQNQVDLWKREAIFKIHTEIWGKRVDVIKNMSSSLAESQKIAMYHSAPDTKGGKLVSRIIFCASSENRQQAESQCAFATKDTETATILRELFDLQSKFDGTRSAAQAYFCEKTKSALQKLPSGAWWWNVNDTTKSQLMTAMESEVYYDMGLIKVLK